MFFRVPFIPSTFIAASIFVLSSCANPAGSGMVARQWAAEMRELQINVVFPPREDFYVGDIFIMPPPINYNTILKDKGYLPISVLGASADVQTELDTYYKSRSSFPITTSNSVTLPGQDAAPQDSIVPQSALNCNADSTQPSPNCSIFTNDNAKDLSRLRLVAFPDFMKATITAVDLAAFIPTEAFTGKLGAMFSNARSLSLKIPVAESVSLPLVDGFNKYKGKSKEICKIMRNVVTTGGDPVPALRAADDDKGRALRLIAVTEVFYTRTIDISVVLNSSAGFGADLTITDPKALAQPAAQPPAQTPAQIPAQAPEQVTKQPGDTSTASPGDIDTQIGKIDTQIKSAQGSSAPGGSISYIYTQIGEINTQIKSAQGRSAPGGSFSVISASQGQIGMRRTFERPLAIGYRGVWILMNTSDCAINGVVTAGGNDNTNAQPTAVSTSPSSWEKPITGTDPTTTSVDTKKSREGDIQTLDLK